MGEKGNTAEGADMGRALGSAASAGTAPGASTGAAASEVVARDTGGALGASSAEATSQPGAGEGGPTQPLTDRAVAFGQRRARDHDAADGGGTAGDGGDPPGS